MVTKLSNLFKGKDNAREELQEAKAVKSGKISPAQYAKGEKMELAKSSKPTAKPFARGGTAKKPACGCKS